MADRTVYVTLHGNVGGFVGSMASAKRSVTGLSSDMERAKAKTASFGRGLATVAKVGVAALAYGVAAVVKNSIQLEAAFSTTMRQMAVATGAPKDEMAALSDLAQELGAKTIYSANEAADAMLALAKNGITPAQIQAGALQSALTLATAGGIDLATAAGTMSNALNAFGLKGRDAASVAAALAGAANASSASVGSLALGLAQAGTVASDTGLTIQETTAAMAAFANAGIAGSDAGTSLKTFLTRLVPSTTKAKTEFDKLNLSFVNGQGEFDSLSQISETLADKLGQMSDADRAAALNTLFGSDARRAATVLINQGADGIDRYIKATSDQTQAEKLAAAATSGTAGSLSRLQGALQTAELQIGEGLAPVVQQLADDIGAFVGSHDLQAWAEDAGRSLVDFGGFISTDVVPPLKVVGGVILDVGKVFAALPGPVRTAVVELAAFGLVAYKLAPILKFATSGLTGLNSRMLAIRGGAAVAGVALLAFGDQVMGADKTLGVLSDTAGGALTGFAVAGPWGAAIGGGIGLVKGLTGAFNDDNDAVSGLSSVTDDYTASLNTLTGAITRTTSEQVRQNLVQDGTAALAKKYGLNLQDVLKAAEGMPAATQRINTELTRQRRAIEQQIEQSTRFALAHPDARTPAEQAAILNNLRDQQSELQNLQDALGATSEKIKQNRSEFQLSNDLAGRYTFTTKELHDAITSLPKSWRTEFQNNAAPSLADVKSYQDLIDLTPTQYDTLLKLTGVPEAKRQQLEWARWFRQHMGKDFLPDEPVNINLSAQSAKVYEQLGGAVGSLVAKATGGPIVGGRPGRDSVPSLLMPGEHVWTAEEVAKAGGHGVMFGLRRLAQLGELPKRGDISHFADGGAVGIRPTVPMPSSSEAATFTRIRELIAQLSAGLSTNMSAMASKLLTYMPVGGALGPGGRLTPAQVLRGQNAARSMVGLPYVWGGASPAAGGFDCSGFMSWIAHQAIGDGSTARMGSTASIPWPGWASGTGTYTTGSTPSWEGSGIGHMAGNIGGLGVESYGGHGPATGSGARNIATDSHFVQFQRFDSGGLLKPGVTLAHNATGHDEHVLTDAQLARLFGRGTDVTALLRTLDKLTAQLAAAKPKEQAAIQRQLATAQNQLAKAQDHARKQLDRTLGGLGFGAHESGTAMRSEFHTFVASLKTIFGAKSPLVDIAKRFTDRLDKVTHKLDEHIKRLGELRNQLRSVVQAERAFTSSALSALSYGDPFAQGNTLSTAKTQLHANINDLARDTRLIHKADAMGLSDLAFRMILSSGDTTILRGLTKNDVQRLNRLARQEKAAEARYRRAAGQAGGFDANEARLHKLINSQTKAVQELRHDLNHLDHKLERAVEKGAYHGTRDAGAGKKRDGHRHARTGS